MELVILALLAIIAIMALVIGLQAGEIKAGNELIGAYMLALKLEKASRHTIIGEDK